jgi:uncharacterized protein YndB with AHSA1/START domain
VIVYGRLEQVDGRWRLQFSRAFGHSLEKVWRALTEPEHLAAWFPTTVDGERTGGAALRFTFPGDEAPPFEGRTLTYDPPSVLEFSWGADVLRFELRPDGAGCLLTLTVTFDEQGRGARDGAGWHMSLDRLAAHLAGAEQDSEPDWAAVHALYVERLGPAASTIGPPEPH